MKGFIGAVTTGVILVVVLIILAICTVKIPAGYVGVIYSMNGGVAEETLSQGWHLVAPTKHVTKYTVGIEQSYLTSEDKGDSWQIIEDEGKLFGGPGNGGILIGDWNVAGRFYMSSIGMGIIYGEPSEKASSSKWKCFEDNTDCKIEQTSIETIAMDNVIVSPNPFSNSFTIEAEGYYIVTNAIGQIIEKGSLDGTSSLGANWPKGIYFLSIDGHVQTVIKK
jgi:hypothetical protein